MAFVYRKTDKGSAEIETRANRLAPRLRSALILVDGRRSDGDLRKLIAVEPDAAIATLLNDGYIEVIATTAARPPARRRRRSRSRPRRPRWQGLRAGRIGAARRCDTSTTRSAQPPNR